ncbi:MAG: DUF2225 domain-containing protein [Treponema sp.]|jgi:uncharacterized protein (DUF2225 family)|nr:DUF2225 domain-containing protein [Treponema sp.]
MKEYDIKVSFQSKDELTCPACGCVFHREELLSGGGRLIAGELTDELHRMYEPSVKYGEVYPLVYQATVCPECWYAAMDKDFTLLGEAASFGASESRADRKDEVKLLFPDVDFYQNRTLMSGAASQYLALRCYEYFSKKSSPTIKQGMAALRAAWLCEDLHKKMPGENYDWVTALFKKKAQYLYGKAVEFEQTGEESLSAAKNLGPDTDKNYGYEGVLYLAGLLNLKYGRADSVEERNESLENHKRTIAKMFGLGKSSKNKPGPLLERAKNLYNRIKKELNERDD